MASKNTMLIILAVLALLYFMNSNSEKEEKEKWSGHSRRYIKYPLMLTAVESGNAKEITLANGILAGILLDPTAAAGGGTPAAPAAVLPASSVWYYVTDNASTLVDITASSLGVSIGTMCKISNSKSTSYASATAMYVVGLVNSSAGTHKGGYLALATSQTGTPATGYNGYYVISPYYDDDDD